MGCGLWCGGRWLLSIDPARPVQTLVMDLLPPAMSDRWDLPERNTLLIAV
ncbi:hypothetical protein [Pasteurella multocida]|nr:hypothetical protein [Pasteurella multocida]